MSADGWTIGHCWTRCETCGAEAVAVGRPAELVHAEGCRRLRAKTVAIDGATGSVTISVEDVDVEP